MKQLPLALATDFESWQAGRSWTHPAQPMRTMPKRRPSSETPLEAEQRKKVKWDFPGSSLALWDTKAEISSRSRMKEELAAQSNGIIESWKAALKKECPFLAIPQEIHLKVFKELDVVDHVCLSLVNKYFRHISPPIIATVAEAHGPFDTVDTLALTGPSISLLLGSPFSYSPVSNSLGCRHCLPVLYSPHHCELSFHLRSFFSRELTFCVNCRMFTKCENKGYSDSKEYCGRCNVSYRRRFEKGRKRLERNEKRIDGVSPPGTDPNIKRVREYFNEARWSDQWL